MSCDCPECQEIEARRQEWRLSAIIPCWILLALIAVICMVEIAHGAELYPITPLEIATTAVLVADWEQTKHISREPEVWFEKNAILGPHPGLGAVDKYFGAVLATNFLMHRLLPPKWMRRLDPVVIAVEGGQVYLNWQIGLR